MPRYKSEITEEEAQELVAILQELKNRNLEIPADTYTQKLIWPLDRNGYFSKLDGTFYNPRDELDKFIHSTARFSALFAGRGSGKSAAGAQKSVLKIKSGQDGAVLNPSFENFKTSTWPEFRNWIPWDLVVPAHKYRVNPEWEPHEPFKMVFKNGVTVICKGLKDPDSARGPNINWLWYDEPGNDRDGMSWRVAIASVRVGNDPQAFATGTPKGRLHWLYKFFDKREGISDEILEDFRKESGGRELIEVFYSSIYDNKMNLDPGFFAAMLAAYPVGWLRDQEIFGKFVDETGSLGDATWFKGKILPSPWEVVEKKVRFWDLAATEKKVTGKKSNDPDETIGTKVSCRPWIRAEDEGKQPTLKEFCLEHQTGGNLEWADIKTIVLETAEKDGPFVEMWLEQEPASGGINQIAELKEQIKEKLGTAYKVEGYRPEGDRVMAANIWFAEASFGQWYMVEGNWNQKFLDQLSGFPDNADHDDRITSVSGARLKIAPVVKKWKTVPFLKV